MASNMQRQAVPLLKTEAPIIGTGTEHRIAVDSGVMVVAKSDGIVKYVSSEKIVLETAEENLTAAESRIRDADMAEELINYTKSSILSQVAMAMLAQAQKQSQSVLQLLKTL